MFTLYVIVRIHIISFFFLLRFLSVKSLNYSIMWVYLLEASECFVHNMRDVPELLFWDRQKLIGLNSTLFVNPYYSYWNTIRNKILITSNITYSFLTPRTIFQLKNVDSPRRLLTDTLLPIIIGSRYCLPFFPM